MLGFAKPYVERSLSPLASLLKDVSPNAITLLGLVFPVVFFVCILQGQYGWALVAFVFNAVDLLDGLIARSQGKVTAFGGFLDSTVDRFADFTILASLSFAGLVSWTLVAPLIMLTYLISYIRSRTELAAKAQLKADVGLIERTERLLIVFVGVAAYALWPQAVLGNLNILGMMCVILIVLSAFTVGQRVWFAYTRLKAYDR